MAEEKERKTFMEKLHGEVEMEVEKDGEKAVKNRVEKLLVAKKFLYASEENVLKWKNERDIKANNKNSFFSYYCQE